MRRPVLILLFLLAAGCGEDEQRAAPEVIRPVRTYRVTGLELGEQTRSFAGVAKAGVESKLSFKVSGTIRRLPIKVGDTLQPGQLVAELDAIDYEVRLQEAEAGLFKAHAEARHAAANYERVRGLYEDGHAAKSELDASRAAAESGAAAVRSSSKQIELARLQLGYTRLRSPTACAVASVPMQVNENVQAGQSVASVACGKTIEVKLAMPEGLIALVREGDDVHVRVDALPDEIFPGRVSEVGVSAGATTFPVTVALTGSAGRVRPGMAAEVVFRFGAKRIGYLVPPAAVGEDKDGRFVYVVARTAPGLGIVHRRRVAVADVSSGGLEIDTGVRPGDLVVTAGISRLGEGQTVRLPAEGQPAQ